MYGLSFLLILNSICIGNSLIEEIPVPRDLQNCYDNHSRKTAIIETVGLSIHWQCLQRKIWKIIDHSSLNITKFERQWVDSILTFPTISPRAKRQSTRQGHRIRKEYRRLTIDERNNYHRAVNLLKQIRFGSGSRYDFIANIHRGDAIPLANFGPNFMGWHRVYLVVDWYHGIKSEGTVTSAKIKRTADFANNISQVNCSPTVVFNSIRERYENALDQVVPGTTLPYFDSSLDYEMEDPTQSIMWSHMFLGNGDGVVTSGPFANWQTRSGPLVRNIGLLGELISKEKIKKVLNRTRTADITYPNGVTGSILEAHSAEVNIWIGGQMNDLNVAPQDPVFFNHLAYIDFIWEQFRIRQTQYGINPSTDYPADVENSLQAPSARMGFETLRNIDGLNTAFTSQIYAYQMSPICFKTNRNCLSPYLKCDASKQEPVCVSLSRAEFAPGNQASSCLKGLCSVPLNKRAFQNRFRSDTRNDIREWVFLPVEIVYHRPPERTKYDSYPVYQSKVMMDTDIYNPISYSGLRNVLKTGQPLGYNKCSESTHNAGKVFIESNGLNYYGTYKEFAMVDNRLALSKSTTYIAVKSPDTGMTDVKLTAHDSCGRICKAYCRVPRTVSDFKPCNGAIRVTTNSPKLYGRNYGESVSDLWTFPSNGHCPSTAEAEYFVKFYCDFKNDWPWTERSNSDTTLIPSKFSSASVPQSPSPSTIKTSPSMEVGGGSKSIPGCLLGHRCVVSRSCGPCSDGERLPCLKSYTMYAWCQGTRFVIRRCVGRSHYDSESGKCTINQLDGIPLM